MRIKADLCSGRLLLTAPKRKEDGALTGYTSRPCLREDEELIIRSEALLLDAHFHG